MNFIAATNNPGKMAELRRILERMGHTVQSQREAGLALKPARPLPKTRASRRGPSARRRAGPPSRMIPAFVSMRWAVRRACIRRATAAGTETTRQTTISCSLRWRMCPRRRAARGL